MNTRTKLQLLQALKRQRREASAGFTLVEVLVVAGILAILFASLVPNLIAARGRAEASAKVSEAVGLARACQAVVASGTGTDDFTNPLDGTAITCNGTASTVSAPFVSKPWSRALVAADNIKCPNAAQTPIIGAGSVQLTVNPATNQIACAVI
jgi:type IV pilus assembly protein PilA